MSDEAAAGEDEPFRPDSRALITSSILDRGRAPADWIPIFASKGLDISERTLRAKARALGACHVIGKAMIITPEQIDMILEDCIPAPKAASVATGPTRHATAAEVMAHLRKMMRQTGSRGASGKSGSP